MRLDPARQSHVAIVGMKGTGKSVLGRALHRSYPGLRMVIDPTGDVAPILGETVTVGPAPVRAWPTRKDHEGVDQLWPEVRFVPSRAARPASYLADMDAMIGLAVHTGGVCVMVDEMAQLFPVGRVPPMSAEVLQMGRHTRTSLIACGPRPKNVDPLLVAQADFVCVFRLSAPTDRERIADDIGLDKRALHALMLGGTWTDDGGGVHTEAGIEPHGFLEFDRVGRTLAVMPPIPLDLVRDRQPAWA